MEAQYAYLKYQNDPTLVFFFIIAMLGYDQWQLERSYYM